MPNWNSENRQYRPVVDEDTKQKEEEARSQREQGKSYSEIANNLGVSPSRVAEYNKDPKNK